MVSIDFEAAKSFLPQYLTGADARALFEEIRQFPANRNYYTPSPVDPADEFIQGDGIRGFVLYQHALGTARGSIAGLVVSNSCDIAPQNRRSLPVNVLFAPLISVNKLQERLQTSGGRDVSAQIADISSQKVTSLFWLPEAIAGDGDLVALFDQISFQPLNTVVENKDTNRLFSLSQYGFWLLLIKLSIHFSRMGEAIKRS